MTAPRFTALVLAGRRDADDPIAAAAGRSCKVFVEVAGVPMLARVTAALEASRSVGDIFVCIDGSASLDEVPEITAQVREGRLGRLPAGTSPSDSVLSAFDALADRLPLLVVTADHPLLTAGMVDHFCREAAKADAAVAVAQMALVEHAYPGALRTRLRFADGAVSGCNLFAFTTPRARRAPEAWARLERNRKRPWRLVGAFGLVPLLLYLTGRLSLAGAMARLSRALDLEARAIQMPFAEAAIDVDKPADLELAEAILRDRGDLAAR